MGEMTPADWPWQHSFPPFFTIQPNLETQGHQLKAWCSLVLKFHRTTKQFTLDSREAERSPLFSNQAISRTLPCEGITMVLNELAKSGHAEPMDKAKTRWYIFWYTLDEWADIIYSWASDSGQINSVCTNYELINTPGVEFTGIHEDVLLKALKVLENKGKAEIITMEDHSGVKFF